MAPVPRRSKPAPTYLKIFADCSAVSVSFFGRIAGAFECFATSVRLEGVLTTRFIIRIAFGIVRFTFGNFVVFHIIGLVRVNVAFRLSLPRPSHALRRTCLRIFGNPIALCRTTASGNGRLYIKLFHHILS
jgi:hypothetical protein